LSSRRDVSSASPHMRTRSVCLHKANLRLTTALERRSAWLPFSRCIRQSRPRSGTVCWWRRAHAWQRAAWPRDGRHPIGGPAPGAVGRDGIARRHLGAAHHAKRHYDPGHQHCALASPAQLVHLGPPHQLRQCNDHRSIGNRGRRRPSRQQALLGPWRPHDGRGRRRRPSGQRGRPNPAWFVRAQLVMGQSVAGRAQAVNRDPRFGLGKSAAGGRSWPAGPHHCVTWTPQEFSELADAGSRITIWRTTKSCSWSCCPRNVRGRSASVERST